MAQEQNLTLYLPFDEADGATKAYDYSTSRADGVVEGATYEAGRQGNCIRFDGNGKCEISPSVLSLNSSFTISAWVKQPAPCTQLCVVVNYAGIDQHYVCTIDTNPDTWYWVAITRDGNVLRVYLNGTLVQRAIVPSTYGNPVGVCFAQDCYTFEGGYGSVDDLKCHQACLEQEDLLTLLDNVKQLTYMLDGVDFKEYGVHVSASKGLLDGLKMKDPHKVEFDGYHGTAIDLSRPRFEEREITLECFITTTGGKLEFVRKVKAFLDQFNARHTVAEGATLNADLCPAGLHRLLVDIHPVKALVYEVYLPDATDIDKTWNDARMTGTFTLKLREPEPVKKVLKHIRTNSSNARTTFTITTDKLVNVYWGDGTTTQDIYGTGKEVAHTFAENGEYFIVITGVIEDITAFDTNDIIIWDKV
ncbi:MAG: LamG domain-containing protein [Muribaculaceae bacterium]|nr:LamG domain-containing protein [Muribaculaceae bacterium]